MAQNEGYDDISLNQRRLRDISLDAQSGIQTMVDNMNKSSNILIPALTSSENVNIVAEENIPKTEFIMQPSVEVININKLKPGDEISTYDKIKRSAENQRNSMTHKDFEVIEIILLSAIVVLLAIAIFK